MNILKISKIAALILALATGPGPYGLGSSISYARDNIRADIAIIPSGELIRPTQDNTNDFRGQGPAAPAPHHKAHVASFGLSRHLVTRGDFALFIAASKYKIAHGCTSEIDEVADRIPQGGEMSFSWKYPGFKQSARDPVVCVNWDDARAYVSWISQSTGHRFRLPTELELAYAARAATNTKWFWGADDNAACRYANFADLALQRDKRWRTGGLAGMPLFKCDDKAAFTSPVGTYLPNPWGLYDIVGNVWEWTADCSNISEFGTSTEKLARAPRPACRMSLPADLGSLHRWVYILTSKWPAGRNRQIRSPDLG